MVTGAQRANTACTGIGVATAVVVNVGIPACTLVNSQQLMSSWEPGCSLAGQQSLPSPMERAVRPLEMHVINESFGAAVASNSNRAKGHRADRRFRMEDIFHICNRKVLPTRSKPALFVPDSWKVSQLREVRNSRSSIFFECHSGELHDIHRMKTHGRTPVVLLLAGLVTLYACHRDPDVAQPAGQEWNGPTPFQLSYPAWAADALHELLIPVDNPLTEEGVALGRKLFHEKALSDDYSMSCATCHQQEFAFSDPRTVSLGTDGSPGRRNSMGIMNPAWDHLFFWDARAASLEMQALGPVVNMVEMRNTWPVVESRLAAHPDYPLLFERAFGSPGVDSMRVVKAIAQFERTLISFNSRFDRFEHGGDITALTPQEQAGRDLYFGEAHCNDCHAAPFFSDNSVLAIGLGGDASDQGMGEVTGDHADYGRFKTTTMRNIEVTAPYMHDGRYATLEQVVDFYADSVDVNAPNMSQHMLPWIAGEIDLDADERAALVAFLKSLTDTEFLNNPAFSDPH